MNENLFCTILDNYGTYINTEVEVCYVDVYISGYCAEDCTGNLPN